MWLLEKLQVKALWAKFYEWNYFSLQSTTNIFPAYMYHVKFYLPVLANPGISELFLKAINCKVGVTFVFEDALAFIPQSNRVRIKCFRFWWKELERYFLRFYGSNINLWVFRILKEGIWSILIEVCGSKIKNSMKSNGICENISDDVYLPLHALNISNPTSSSLGIVYNLLNNISLKQI